MKAATIQEIKQELLALPHTELADITLRLARSKKENKELLTFLLFESHDISGYIETVKKEMDVKTGKKTHDQKCKECRDRKRIEKNILGKTRIITVGKYTYQ